MAELLSDLRYASPQSVQDFSGLNPYFASRADPWIARIEGLYTYCYADGKASIYIAQAERLDEFPDAKPLRVWKAPAGSAYAAETWAPEVHQLDGRCYIYFAASNGRNANHRMYVLESAGPDARGPYQLRGAIKSASDRWAIDGTVLDISPDERYFLWSGWAGQRNVQQNIYIARMDSPWSLAPEPKGKDRVLLSAPTEPWERHGGPPYVNEAPQILRHGPHLHLIYSASGSWTDHYCLGQLTYRGGAILDPVSWSKTGPVFASHEGIYAPGHACFVREEETGLDWMIYHVAKHRGAGWKRNVHRQVFTWNAHGQAVFGKPLPLQSSMTRWSDIG